MRVIKLFLFYFLLSTPAWADIDSLREEATIATNSGEHEIAAEKLRQILELEPNDGVTHYQLGTVLMNHDGDLFDAVEHFERARELEFQTQAVAYQLARLYVRLGRQDDALQQLEIAADSGFGLIDRVDNQADFDAIRDQPRFIAARETIRAARYPCDSDERHHAFDFWIGKWVVEQAGQKAGDSNVQAILGHCTIFEQWESVAGTSGKSFNYYDPAHDHWRQIWIGDGGTFIEFTGEARDGGIFFTAETINPADGAKTLHKFEFTRIDDDGVRQYWETSADDGESWQTVWDGRYTRVADTQ